ncbi:receptor-interacting serine/threonine-protein kinase 4-like isoform X2 [Melanotaenia boesemani]|uniref:receptor-interacting serine/threonine-protein kinase 4-like isoform X2 n=1 Tax=Melanotaenia boesemani TaxID=1250792 RepID=UPI001C05D7A5|nr:receptor-interacting serine/threonine-protein kinase 4-like isoform X2 [Melanotaenia boesemani]
MALLSRERVGNNDLEGKWECIGCGGFGKVYKTKYKTLGVDVAIKLGCHSTGSITMENSLYEEARVMEQASFNFVLRVYGIYEGCPPGTEMAWQEGIVMEFMERGSIHTLLVNLSGPPPWPLAFRLAHQVALGMNFLHLNDLVHQDLKPSNVLLDDGFNAKLADFGLSRVSTSALKCDEEKTELIGGTDKYMPPEAFNPHYKPVRSFDIYSYGILLWSIFSGKEPYPEANANALLKIRIPKGDRPLVEELEKKQVDGLKALVELMIKCWDEESSKRPLSSEIIRHTEKVSLKYKERIPNAIHEVLNKLDPQTSSHDSQPSEASSFTSVTPGQSMSVDVVDHLEFATETSVSVGPKVLTEKEKEG